MKRLKIKNPYANFISPDFATDEEMQAWINSELHNGNYGKPAWTEKKLIGEMKYENGQDVSEYEVIEHPAEYSYVPVDITDELTALAQEKINAEALAYLASTDWYNDRFLDEGIPMPDDVKAKRKEARQSIVK